MSLPVECTAILKTKKCMEHNPIMLKAADSDDCHSLKYDYYVVYRSDQLRGACLTIQSFLGSSLQKKSTQE